MKKSAAGSLRRVARCEQRYPRRSLWRLGAGALALGLATSSGAADGGSIEQLYAAAKANDPVLGAAKADYLARKQILPQSRAALLPSISMGGSTSKNSRSFPGSRIDVDPASPTFGQIFNVPSQVSNSHGWNAQLRQPVFNAASWFNFRRAQALSVQAEHDLANAERNLIVRVAAAYLNVLRAQARVEAARAEEQAVKRQLEQVQQRFDVGLVAITDVLESTAAYDASVVRRIQADGDHDVFFETLKTITGVAHESVDSLDSALPIVDPEPDDEGRLGGAGREFQPDGPERARIAYCGAARPPGGTFRSPADPVGSHFSQLLDNGRGLDCSPASRKRRAMSCRRRSRSSRAARCGRARGSPATRSSGRASSCRNASRR